MRITILGHIESKLNLYTAPSDQFRLAPPGPAVGFIHKKCRQSIICQRHAENEIILQIDVNYAIQRESSLLTLSLKSSLPTSSM